MNKYFDPHFKTNVTIVEQGESYSTKKSEIITTVLGSCIAVCLYEPAGGMGGLNHFMLPEPLHSKGGDDQFFNKAKYGVYSMELLLNQLMKMGAVRSALKAKVFGGANMFSYEKVNEGLSVGEQNTEFVMKYLDMEKIKLESYDVAGSLARKVFFDPKTGYVKLFRLNSDKKEQEKLQDQEKSFLEKIRESLDKAQSVESKVTFFD